MNSGLKSKIFRILSVLLACNLLLNILFPTIALALTSGPSAPEVQSFEPVGTTEMVDLFTGDFTYNIPLFELPGPNGGYPFNIHYNSGITMDQEASWVGLGWNLNPGAINRQMRGFPDEFDGALVKKEMDIKPNVTYGAGVGASIELFGGDPEVAGGSFSLGIGVYYNNYRGVGYNIEPSLSFHSAEKNGMTAGVGFGMSLDSQEGLGMNASLSLSDETKDNTNNFNLGLGYNSNAGLTGLSMGFSATAKERLSSSGKRTSTKDGFIKKGAASMGGSSAISMAGTAYSPSVSMPMEGRSLSLTFKMGGAALGAFGNGSINGFFSTQYIKHKSVTQKAYGYLNLQEARIGEDLLDFNREKDGMIRKNSPNLAIPSMTFDIYSVTGQGIGGMYRAFRNDVGVLSDAKVSSRTVGGAAGVDIGPGPSPHIGANVTVNYSESVSGKWDDYNDVAGTGGYSFTKASGKYEPYYFKTYGEHTTDPENTLAYIKDEGAVKIDLENAVSVKGIEYRAMDKFAGSGQQIENTNSNDSEREPRNLVIHPIDNDFNRGLFVINADGSKYVYGRVAMNIKHVEAQFTVGGGNQCATTVPTGLLPNSTDKPNYKVSNTDEYFNRTNIPDYAYAYLLSEILGPDYVDADAISGPSEGDFGYWVKFSYEERKNLDADNNVSGGTNYNWRVPFTGANFMGGKNTTNTDDKASYMYGEKEQYYLSKVETKSHIAVFSVSPRGDARGAKSQIQDLTFNPDGTPIKTPTVGAYSYKLDRISLFTRNEYGSNPTSAVPIKTIHFSYTYDLCKNVQNNEDPNGGKLTLNKIHFTYQNNNRGSLSPYVFDYHQTDQLENPDYDTHKYDRWGNYKPNVTCDNLQLPYTDQFRSDDASQKAALDRNMAVWNLKSITLPSGGTINVDYESDDYAYVQNKVAMQMTPITGTKPFGYYNSEDINHHRYAGGDRRRVYFDLEYPISTSLNTTDKQAEIDKYNDGTGKLYFKVFMKLKKKDHEYEDYVSGYADVNHFGIDEASIVNGNFTRGYVQLEHLDGFHPFSVAAWQHIRTNAPEVNGIGGNLGAEPNSSMSTQVAKIKSLVSIIATIGQTFVGFRTYAHKNNWADRIASLQRSVIRLNSPDKCKFGGGLRVKQITLNDGWQSASGETSSSYGQVYDYTMEEGGQKISSGVAAYEPMIGGDEIPLRTVKEYPEKVPLKTNNNLFFELPVNESYYPGPQVGYRKVKVQSLATYYAAKTEDDIPGGLNIPAGIMTTGATEHEFYSAKEFPVITDETNISIKPFNLHIPLPLIGQITVNNLTASQGYSIVLNDMHGKPKKVTTYRQDLDKDQKLVLTPISWVKYNYQTNLVKKDANPLNDYYTLNNLVNVISGDIRGVVSPKVQKLIGQDHEFFTDMRQSEVFSSSGGANINTDVIIIPPAIVLPAFVPWPNIGSSTTKVRTVVTNKIIHKSGILISTEAFNEGSLIKTENKVFDELTGQPILTTVNNNFDDPIYNYTIPGHFKYEGMGPAYKNIGYKFTATFSGTAPTFSTPATTELESMLVPGDEFLFSTNQKAIYVEKKNGMLLFFTGGSLSGGPHEMTLIRSGRRNLLGVNVGSIVTLGDKNDPIIGDPTLMINRQ